MSLTADVLNCRWQSPSTFSSGVQGVHASIYGARLQHQDSLAELLTLAAITTLGHRSETCRQHIFSEGAPD